MTAAIIIFALLILTLFLILPAKGHREMPAVFYAHRGLHDSEIPENSLAAFRAAREHGFAVELDVQYTKDRKIVVFHDGDLKRVCGVDRDLIDLTYEETRELRLCSSDEQIPLFSEVLEVMAPLPIICEIKAQQGNANCEICPEVRDMLRAYPGPIVMESFSPIITGWFKKNAPDIIRGQLVADTVKESKGFKKIEMALFRDMMFDFFSRPNFIAYDHTAKAGMMKLLRKFTGVVTVAWTPRGRDEITKASEAYDCVIFEKGGDTLEEIFRKDTV